MSWRDDLLPASFRGVPFFVNDHELALGRRNAEHEFPLRDTGFVEDLGKKNRHYRVIGYVIVVPGSGESYFPDRDALIAALEQGGTGTLSHPYLGELTVNVANDCRVKETLEEGGMATFTMEFIDSGSNPSPVSQQDTQGNSQNQADQTDQQLGDDFGVG